MSRTAPSTTTTAAAPAAAAPAGAPDQQSEATAQHAGTFARARRWARRIKRDTYALYLAARDPRTPVYAKLFAACVVAYAFSPIDLIPDFIPVLGYLDDVIIVPLGIMLALKMVPASIMAECRAEAEATRPASKPRSYVGAAAIVVVWLLAAGLCVQWAVRVLN